MEKDKATTRIQKRVQDSNASNKYRIERKKRLDEEKAHKITKGERDEAKDFVRTLTQENLELNNIIKSLKARYEKECTHYTTDNNGNVTSYTELKAYRSYAHVQELDSRMKYIKTPLYQKNEHLRFVYVEDGNYKINEKKWNKFQIIGGLK